MLVLQKKKKKNGERTNRMIIMFPDSKRSARFIILKFLRNISLLLINLLLPHSNAWFSQENTIC